MAGKAFNDGEKTGSEGGKRKPPTNANSAISNIFDSKSTRDRKRAQNDAYNRGFSKGKKG